MVSFPEVSPLKPCMHLSPPLDLSHQEKWGQTIHVPSYERSDTITASLLRGRVFWDVLPGSLKATSCDQSASTFRVKWYKNKSFLGFRQVANYPPKDIPSQPGRLEKFIFPYYISNNTSGLKPSNMATMRASSLCLTN